MRTDLRTRRLRLLLAAVATALLAAAGAGAAAADDGQRGENGGDRPTFVEPSLLRKAHDKPNAEVRVIVQADSAAGAEDAVRGVGGQLGRRLGIVRGVAARMPAQRVQKLARRRGLVVTPDLPVGPSSTSLEPPGFSSGQLWPAARLVSVDVLNDAGMGYTSDVIAGVDWVLQHKDEYGIRVVNLSLTGSDNSSFMYDPLDKAVERLWFGGVVVAAVGNNWSSSNWSSSTWSSSNWSSSNWSSSNWSSSSWSTGSDVD